MADDRRETRSETAAGTPVPRPQDGEHLLERTLDLLAALRRAGLPATTSDAIDAVRALAEVGLLERARVRAALSAVSVTSAANRRVFDELFDLYFPARPGTLADEGPATVDGDPDGFVDELEDELERGDEDRVRALARDAVERFARVDGRDGGSSFFLYRVERAVDLAALLERMLSRVDDDRLDPLERLLLRQRFEARLRAFRQEVEVDVRRRSAARYGLRTAAPRLVRPPVTEQDLVHLTPQEQRELVAAVRPLARKLASRVAVRRRQGRRGRLDVRRTMRRSLSTGGVPFRPAFRPRRPHRPELFVLCDVSGSVASFARFTLLLVHTLQAQFAAVRSFAFIDELDEVTRLFDSADPQEAVRRVLAEADVVGADGSSDYGRCLERFHHRHASDVGPRSTVLVLGDARNNHRQANTWALAEVRRRARRVYWLNPESIAFWDTGDSLASSYARVVDDMVEVRTLTQLAGFVERVASGGARAVPTRRG